VTTRIRNIASEVELGPADGLPRRCVANLDTITTTLVPRLTEQITNLGGAVCLLAALLVHWPNTCPNGADH